MLSLFSKVSFTTQRNLFLVTRFVYHAGMYLASPTGLKIIESEDFLIAISQRFPESEINHHHLVFVCVLLQNHHHLVSICP